MVRTTSTKQKIILCIWLHKWRRICPYKAEIYQWTGCTQVFPLQWLLEKKITVVGTLQTTRIGIPDKLKSTKDREDLSSTIYWEEENKDMVMCTYTVKTKSSGWKNVLMLSTMQPLLGITRDDEKKNPALYKFYDFTKGGTDIVDQKIGSYTCKAKSPKWKMVALYYILDTSV